MSEHANMAAADLDHMARLRQERDAARADSAWLRAVGADALALARAAHHYVQTYETTTGGDERRMLAGDRLWSAAGMFNPDAPHPGASLLAELDAARRVVVAARAALNGALFEYRRPLEEALQAYQTTTTTTAADLSR